MHTAYCGISVRRCRRAIRRTRLLLVGAVLLFSCNVPAQSRARVIYDEFIGITDSDVLERGWPFVYLVRSRFIDEVWPPPFDLEDCFLDWRFHDFRLIPLVANVSILIAVPFLVRRTYHVWRMKRKHYYQFHLGDMLVLITVCALITAWIVFTSRRNTEERRVLQSIRELQDVNENINVPSNNSLQLGGITWLRFVLGSPAFEWLDRPFNVAIRHSWCLEQLVKLRSVRCVEIDFRVTTRDLQKLADLPNLELLQVRVPNLPGQPIDTLELPRLPQLRGLDLDVPRHLIRGLERVGSIESLSLDADELDDIAAAELQQLSKLRWLKLRGAVPINKIALFLSARTSLQVLQIESGELDSSGCHAIATCGRLTRLSCSHVVFPDDAIDWTPLQQQLQHLLLNSCRLSPDAARGLSQLQALRSLEIVATESLPDLSFVRELQRLEQLSLSLTKIRELDLRSLADLPMLRRLDLVYLPLSDQNIQELSQLKQITWLAVSEVSDGAVQALRLALPLCDIEKHASL